MRVFSLISTKHSLAYTANALRSFYKTTPYNPADRIILIDNDGSFENSPEWTDLEVLVNPRPLGFAENANQMVRLALAEGADLFLMNNDIIFSAGWMESCESEPNCVSSPLSNREVPYDLETVKTPVVMKLEQYLANTSSFEELFKTHRASISGSLTVIILPFFCVRIPHCVLSKVGEFDERFGRGGAEDYDYCLRTYLAGFEVKYILPSFVIHFGGKSSWGGVESKQEQDEREFMFRSEFGVKWGVDLLKLCLFEDRSYFAPGSQYLQFVQEGRHAEVVRALMHNPTL